MTTLFSVFWMLGWSVGVLALGALTCSFYSLANRRGWRVGGLFMC